MVLIRRYPNGVEIYGPPYTRAEENEFYKRISDGWDKGVTVLRDPTAKIGYRPEARPAAPRKSRRRSPAEPPQT